MMPMKKTCALLAAVLGLSGVTLRATAAEENEASHKHEKVTMEQLPAPVASTLREQAKGGKIEELRKEPNGKGGFTYEAEVVHGNKGTDLELDANGRVLSSQAHSEKGEREKGEHEAGGKK